MFQGGAVDARDALIAGNHGAGVQVYEDGTVDVRRSEISGSLSVGTPAVANFNGGHGIVAGFHSTVRVRGTSTITGNAGAGIRIFNDSGVDFRAEGGAVPQVSGNALWGYPLRSPTNYRLG
ncbi:MAG: hypothetical protein HYU51_19370 [Candidatus Rokubacteria bacterium]|nr:hypothetical protein [Candidatus Rokubacteria bacterium]